MMRIMLLFLAILMPLPALAEGFGGAVWRVDTLHVYDYSPPEWDGIFAQTVEDANAMLPRRAPEVVYHRMPEMTCGSAPYKRGAVVICQGSPERWAPEFRNSAAFVFFSPTDHTMKRARVEINEKITPDSSAKRRIACHELIGHAILGVHDDYNSKAPDESCVHGRAERPGTWDQAVARWLYKKFVKKR